MKRPSKKRTLAMIQREIREAKKRIGAERDKLRDLVSELESIEESCDNAENALERAADYLSEYL